MLALWVVLHHISGPGMMLEGFVHSLPPALQIVIHGGYLAVQTFFVLSGFVLARSYANERWDRENLIRFAAARVARIYPVYLLSLVVVFPFIVGAMEKPGRSVAEKAGLLASYGFLLQGWAANLGVGWNTPAWTLSCELFFYLCFPLIFPAIRAAGRRGLGLVLAACMVTPILLAHAGVPWNWKPLHHLSDFAAGIAAAGLFDRLRPRMVRRGYLLYAPALLAGVLVILFPAVLDGTYADLNTALRPLNVLALLGFAVGGGVAARALASDAAQYLGKASYSLYILHVPVLWWYSHWAMHGSWHMSGLTASGLYFAIIVAVSALAFELVETPANRWIRGQVSRTLARPEPVLLRRAA